MRDYELTVLLPGELKSPEIDKEAKKLCEDLEKAGVKITRKVDPVKKPLAYEIAKNKEAYYIYLEFQVLPGKLEAVGAKLKSEEKIIRYLYVSKISK